MSQFGLNTEELGYMNNILGGGGDNHSNAQPSEFDKSPAVSQRISDSAILSFIQGAELDNTSGSLGATNHLENESTVEDIDKQLQSLLAGSHDSAQLSDIHSFGSNLHGTQDMARDYESDSHNSSHLSHPYAIERGGASSNANSSFAPRSPNADANKGSKLFEKFQQRMGMNQREDTSERGDKHSAAQRRVGRRRSNSKSAVLRNRRNDSSSLNDQPRSGIPKRSTGTRPQPNGKHSEQFDHDDDDSDGDILVKAPPANLRALSDRIEQLEAENRRARELMTEMRHENLRLQAVENKQKMSQEELGFLRRQSAFNEARAEEAKALLTEKEKALKDTEEKAQEYDRLAIELRNREHVIGELCQRLQKAEDEAFANSMLNITNRLDNIAVATGAEEVVEESEDEAPPTSSSGCCSGERGKKGKKSSGWFTCGGR